MKAGIASLFAIVIGVSPQVVRAADLYAATGQGEAGELLILDPATGAILTDVGPLNDSAARNFGMTAIAFDPVSGVLYGSSANANSDTSTRGQLVTINPATGLVTPIGSFGLAAGGTMTDLAFDPTTHVLYGLPSNGGASLFTIDPATAQSTMVGPSGFTATNGGSLAVALQVPFTPATSSGFWHLRQDNGCLYQHRGSHIAQRPWLWRDEI